MRTFVHEQISKQRHFIRAFMAAKYGAVAVVRHYSGDKGTHELMHEGMHLRSRTHQRANVTLGHTVDTVVPCESVVLHDGRM